jgi:hypothetical protein
MAAGTFRPALLASAAARARARRVVDFRYALPPALVAGYDLPGLTTYIDAGGVVRYQPHNFLPDSKNIVTGFLGQNIAKVSSAVAPPIGQWSDTVWKLVEDTNNARHYWYRNSPAFTAGAVNWFYVPARAAERTRLFIEVWDGTVASLAIFNLSAGTCTGVGASMLPLGDGWWLCLVQRSCVAATGDWGFGPHDGIGQGYQGNGSSGVLVCAPVHAASAQEVYVPTTTAARHLPALFDNGRRGLRLEGPQTQLFRSVDALNASPWFSGNSNVAANAAGNYRGLPLWELANIAGGPGNYAQNLGAQSALSVRCHLFAGTVSQLHLGVLASGWIGTITKISGPGTVTPGVGEPHFVTGLSPTVPTIVEIFANAAGASAAFYFYPKQSSGGGVLAGDSFRVQVENCVPDSLPGTSRIPNASTSATALRPGAQQVISGAEFSRLFPAARARGPELVANGSFATDTAWTKGAGWAISGGAANASTAGSASLSQNIGIVSGRAYIATFDLTITSGNVSSFIGGNSLLSNMSAGAKSAIVAAGSANSALAFDALNAFVGSVDNVSLRELDTSVPSLQAFTLFITLADRPRAFVDSQVMVIFALNNGGAYTAGPGLLVRDTGTGAVSAGGNNAVATNGAWVSGKNVIGVGVDVANKRISLSMNGAAATFITNADYTGIGANLAQLRALDSSGGQGAGVVQHQTLEVLPLMSDAALQAECARRFALP